MIAPSLYYPGPNKHLPVSTHSAVLNSIFKKNVVALVIDKPKPKRAEVRNWKRRPKDPRVQQYIECYWALEKQQGDDGNNYPKLNPDPAAHLILSPNDQNYRYSQEHTKQCGKGCHWIFPHKKTFTLDHSQAFLVVGIKFKPGSLYSLNGLAPDFSLDQIIKVDMNALCQTTNFELNTLLATAIDYPELSGDILDSLLLPWVSQCQLDKHSQLILRALPLLDSTPIAKLGMSLHCSQRTIERSFLRVSKLTLKQFQSMTRLEEILAYLYSLETQDINWAELAIQYEFSDQPHLIRYLKSSIGTTPGEYIKQRDLTIDVYGDFE